MFVFIYVFNDCPIVHVNNRDYVKETVFLLNPWGSGTYG